MNVRLFRKDKLYMAGFFTRLIKDDNYTSKYINDYLLTQKNYPFSYLKEEILEAGSIQLIIHLFIYKSYLNQTSKENGKICANYAKMAEAAEKLKI